MNQIEKLNKELSRYLNERSTLLSKRIKRTIKFDNELTPDGGLTEDEIFLIKETVKNKNLPCGMPTIIYISRKHYLDFIGWDRPEFYDVLICKK